MDFGRFRGPNGPAGGAFAPGEVLEIAAAAVGGGCGGRLAALVLASLASAGGFPDPERGGKCQFSPTRKGGESASSARPGKGGKVPSLALAEISRRWRLRGGAGWRQRSFAFLARPAPPPLAGVRPYQAQRGLF